MRLLFLRSTGLGDQLAEPNQVVEVDDLVKVREFISTGRAQLAPDEEPLPKVPVALTTTSFGGSPDKKAQKGAKS